MKAILEKVEKVEKAILEMDPRFSKVDATYLKEDGTVKVEITLKNGNIMNLDFSEELRPDQIASICLATL